MEKRNVCHIPDTCCRAHANTCRKINVNLWLTAHTSAPELCDWLISQPGLEIRTRHDEGRGGGQNQRSNPRRGFKSKRCTTGFRSNSCCMCVPDSLLFSVRYTKCTIATSFLSVIVVNISNICEVHLLLLLPTSGLIFVMSQRVQLTPLGYCFLLSLWNLEGRSNKTLARSKSDHSSADSKQRANYAVF